MRSRTWPLAALLAVVAALMAGACGGDDDDTPTSTPRATSSAAVSGTVVKEPVDGNLPEKLKALTIPAGTAQGRKLGKDDAKVKVQMYEDFRCPHCLEFTAYFEQYLVDAFVKTGVAQLEFKYFPLGQASLAPMVAAECANRQGQFWPYGHRLFTAQAQAGDAAGLASAFSESMLKAYAAELKLDAATFEACLADPSALDAVAADYRDGNAAGIKGTPGFIVNGQLQPGPPGSNANWKAIIEGAARSR